MKILKTVKNINYKNEDVNEDVVAYGKLWKENKAKNKKMVVKFINGEMRIVGIVEDVKGGK